MGEEFRRSSPRTTLESKFPARRCREFNLAGCPRTLAHPQTGHSRPHHKPAEEPEIDGDTSRGPLFPLNGDKRKPAPAMQPERVCGRKRRSAQARRRRRARAPTATMPKRAEAGSGTGD